MAHITRRQLLLLFLGVGKANQDTEGINGITRLQKLLFLLEQEFGFKPDGDGFNFEPYKAGPYSAGLYDDLELLDNLGYIESEVSGQITDAEAVEIDLLDFSELMGDESETHDELGPTPDAYEERRFKLTNRGKEKAEELEARRDLKDIVNGIRRIKSKYSHYSLSDLLYHVYTKYPQMTTESEIKDKVLNRRPLI